MYSKSLSAVAGKSVIAVGRVKNDAPVFSHARLNRHETVESHTRNDGRGRQQSIPKNAEIARCLRREQIRSAFKRRFARRIHRSNILQACRRVNRRNQRHFLFFRILFGLLVRRVFESFAFKYRYTPLNCDIFN